MLFISHFIALHCTRTKGRNNMESTIAKAGRLHTLTHWLLSVICTVLSRCDVYALVCDMYVLVRAVVVLFYMLCVYVCSIGNPRQVPPR